MEIILFRHGEKSAFPFDDPELTANGKRQAKNLVPLVVEGKLPAPEALFSSPKRRAQNTLRELSQHLNSPVMPLALWNEQQPHESHTEFIQRLQKGIYFLEAQPHRVIYACTHMDVLLHLQDLLASQLAEKSNFALPSGGYLHFEIEKSNLAPHIWRFLNSGNLPRG